jgi:catechol 2,3-dioxygenase-like lactoylglutathione lyase family enzyme
MTVSVNGIAHIQLTVNDPERCLPFWEKLCHFMDMKTLLRNEESIYCIGSRTGILVRGAPPEKRGTRFDQDTSGLHHICFRARSAADVAAIADFAEHELGAKIIHRAEDGSQFAPGYFSVLFEDPDGIRIEANHVPGKGHFGSEGRLGAEGTGPASSYGEDGLTNKD